MNIFNNEINIIIPMGGLGSRFSEYGFTENKYLLPMDTNLTKMIDIAILTLINKINNLKCRFIFILREENGENINLRNHLHNICQINGFECTILSINYLTEGPASTAYLAKELISNDIPLIISNSDQALDWNFMNFFKISTDYDGCVLTYEPSYEIKIGETDKHSFVKFDEDKKPIEFIEKKAISKDALVGVHFYKTGLHFIKAYEYIYNNNIRAPNGEFYLSYTYQALLNMNYTVGTYKLQNDEGFYPVGEPIDYFNYYNKTSPIIKYNINDSNDLLSQYKNIFLIKFGKKGDSIFLNKCLFILINGKINSEKSEYNLFICNDTNIELLEDSCYCIVQIKNSLPFSYINTNDYIRGWLIGNFIPSIEKTIDYEVGYLQHSKSSFWNFHFHKISTEINILVKGKMIINNIIYEKDDIFIINNNVISCPIFIDDCELICIKIPSVPNDKYLI